jgi:SAM-dependent methyltransferase
MTTKPRHLTTENAARFQDQSLVDVYHHRLPYPQAVYDRLLSLLANLPRVVLDVGTGTGDLARGLVDAVTHVDAIDVSEAMIGRGRLMTNGQHPNLKWIHGRVEDAHLQTSYSLIIGGDSIHWLDWEKVFPLFHDLLHSDGYVVIIGRRELPTAWHVELGKLIVEFSVIKDFEQYDLIDELEKRYVFQVVGRETTAPVVATQSIDDYVASFHSRGSLSPAAMTADAVHDFDARLRALVEPYVEDNQLELQTEATIVWGKPLVG